MDPQLQEMITNLNYCALFVAGLSGAAAGIKRRADYFGVVVIAYVTACSGGIVRDILLGDHPPENIRTWQPITITTSAAMVALFFFPRLQGFLKTHIQTFDAFGLGLFTVIGATKGLSWDVSPIAAVFLGVITGIGGGVARDIILARAPSFLHSELYATSSLAGGLIVVVGSLKSDLTTEVYVILGAAVCTAIRLVSLHFNLNMPTAWSQAVESASSRLTRRFYKE